MTTCPVCAITARGNLCTNCGWQLDLDARSDYYRRLRNEQLKLWRRLLPGEEATPDQHDDLEKDCKKVESQIKRVENELTAAQARLTRVEEERKTREETDKGRRPLIVELNNLDVALRRLDHLIKPFEQTVSQRKLICEFKGDVITFEGVNIEELPSLMLVISKKRLYGATRDADLFIRIDQQLASTVRNRWRCVIPNELGLKGRYYAMITNMHDTRNGSVKIRCLNQEVKFT